MDVPNATPETEQPQVDAQVEAPPAATPMQVQPQSPESGQPPQPQAPPPPSPEQQAAMAQQAHDTFIGKAAKMLLGNTTSYQVDPTSGQMVATQAPQQPGALFRNILAGAILGGALGQQAGARPGGGPAAAALAGAGGEMQQLQGQDDSKKAAAQGQFQDQMKAQQNQREQDDADQQENLRKAQLAHANITTLQLQKQSQGSDLANHKLISDAGQANMKTWYNSGLTPVFEDIPESKMAETIQNYPGASALDWTHSGVVSGGDLSKATGLNVEATGEKFVDDPNSPAGGHYEYTYTAFDPKGPVNLDPATLSQWKKDGFLDSLQGSAKDVLKAGMPLDAGQVVALKNKHEQFQLADQQQKAQKHNETMAQLAEDQARANIAAKQGSADKAEAAVDKASRGSAAQSGSDGDVSGGSDYDARVDRASKNFMAGNDTLATLAKGMGKQTAKFQQDVKDHVLQLNQGKYDFAGHEQEYKTYIASGTQQKLQATQTLTGTDGKSGLLGDLRDAVHAAGLTSIPKLNDVQAWSRIESGSTAGIKAHQLLNDVAEQYGALFANGGATSDAKIALAQENFPKNFNNGQIDEAVKAARTAIDDRMTPLARHNRFVMRNYGNAIYVPVKNEHGQTGSVPLNKLDDWLAANKQRSKR